MTGLTNKIIAFLSDVTGKPLHLIGLTVVVLGIGFGVQVAAPYDTYRSNASGAHLHPPSALELKGQEVYKSSGCMYCHTQNLRPFPFEVQRFTDLKQYGYFPLENPMERYYEAPYLRGSKRIGPDLSRLAGKYDANGIKRILKGKSGSKLARAHHSFGYLYGSDMAYDAWHALALSYRIRGMMQAGSPFSDADQKSVFDAITGRTQGQALTAYLLSLGARKQQFAGKYFK